MTGGDSLNAITKRRRKRRRGKWHGATNCGTKEPKRPTEKQIEWHKRGKVIVQGSRKEHNRSNRFNTLHEVRLRQRQAERLRRKRQRQQRQRAHRLEILESLEHGAERHERKKRSISSPRHVEALIVADPTMVAFHQDGDVETYLLTIMNMVSSLYKDPAIGNHIKVVVVRIVLLEEDESHPDFNVTHLADKNLNNFCR